MQITIEIQDEQQAILILKMLEAVPKATITVSETKKLTAKDVAHCFGSLTTKLSLQEIDARLKLQKEEWL